MANTFVFSCLPQMVKSEKRQGFMLVLSVLQNILAEYVVSKFSSVVTQICLLVASIPFGFSQSWNWSIITHFIQGCSKGQYVVALALVANVCDSTNRADGFRIHLRSVFRWISCISSLKLSGTRRKRWFA